MVSRPAVMHARPLEGRQYADLIHRRLTTPLVTTVMRQLLRARHVHVSSFASHSQTRLIHVDDLRLLEPVFDPPSRKRPPPSTSPNHPPKPPRRDGAQEEVTEQFPGPPVGKQLIVDEVDGSRPHPAPV